MKVNGFLPAQEKIPWLLRKHLRLNAEKLALRKQLQAKD